MSGPADLEIRLARAEEHDLVYRLMLEGFASSRVYELPSSALAETRADVDRAVRGGAALLAFQAGRPVGSARLLPAWRTPPGFDVAAVLERAAGGRKVEGSPGGVLRVSRMSVLPGARNRGIGAGMLAWIEALAERLGLDAVELSVRSQQPDNRPYYQRLGYHVTGYSGRYGIADMSTHMCKQLPGRQSAGADSTVEKGRRR